MPGNGLISRRLGLAMRNDQVFVLLLVILMPLSGCIGNSENNQINFQPESRDELKTAVDEWIDDSDNANSTYGEINTGNTSLITNMSGLFLINWIVSIDLSDWDVSSVTDMFEMFEDAKSFNQDISEWNVSSVSDMSLMFKKAVDLSDDNKCAIHASFSSNNYWDYDWESYCSD